MENLSKFKKMNMIFDTKFSHMLILITNEAFLNLAKKTWSPNNFHKIEAFSNFGINLAITGNLSKFEKMNTIIVIHTIKFGHIRIFIKHF